MTGHITAVRPKNILLHFKIMFDSRYLLSFKD